MITRLLVAIVIWTTVKWRVMTTAQETTTGTRYDSPPPPPPPTEPPTTDEDKWPWWWWIPVVGGSALILVVLVGLCVCLCCRRPRRRRVQSETLEENGDTQATLRSSSNGGVFLRRLDSTSAKRYLHNLVSVFSWGSDFDPSQDETRGISPTPSPRTSHVYVNPDTLPIHGRDVAPPRPPRKNETNHYLNIN